MTEREFDPRLVLAANTSFGWIFESFRSFKQTPNRTISELLQPHVRDGACDLINPGLVLAAAYIYFVYPKEALLELLRLDGLHIDRFTVTPATTPKQLVRRLRNSLSHSRFVIDDDGVFTFKDNKADGTDRFEGRIAYADFAEFVEQFGLRAVQQFSP